MAFVAFLIGFTIYLLHEELGSIIISEILEGSAEQHNINGIVGKY